MNLEQGSVTHSNSDEELRCIQFENAGRDIAEITREGSCETTGSFLETYDSLSGMEHPREFAMSPLTEKQKKELVQVRDALKSLYGVRFLEVLTAWKAAEPIRQANNLPDVNQVTLNGSPLQRDNGFRQLSLGIK